MWGLVTLAALLAWASSASAANLLTDTFTYPNGSLNGKGTWANHSGTLNQMQVTNGRAIVVQASTASEDLHATYAVQPATAKTFASFKLVVTDTTSLSVANYFAHFKKTANTTDFRARVFVARDSGTAGRYKIGLSASSTAPNDTASIIYFPGSYTVGSMHVVVTSYNGANGQSELWVDPVSEASTKVTRKRADAAGDAVAEYALRQGSLTGNVLTEAVDDLGVGTTFTDALLSADIGLTSLCVTDSTKVCGTRVFTNQPWHILFSVINKGQKSVNNWSYDIILQQLGSPVTIPIKTQVTGQPLPAGGQGITINWPSPVIFASDQKGPWMVTVVLRVKEANQTDPSPTNNSRSFQFVVENKFTPVSDLSVDAVCAADDSLKQCRPFVYTNQPWHILFTVHNNGNKPVDNWSFDISLTTPTSDLALKTQVMGPPLQLGETATINWPSPHIFSTAEKGNATITVGVKVKDPGNPDPNPANDRKSATFAVQNKTAISDLAVRGVCASRPDTTGGGIGCTVFLDQASFRAFNQSDGKFLKGIETFEETDVPPGGKSMCPAPFGPNPGCGFPNGLTQRNLLIQDNITPGPDPPSPNPSGKLNALYVINSGFIGANSAKVGEDIFLDGRNASIDLIFTEPNHTGVGFRLSRFNGYPNGGWHITVYNKADQIISTYDLPAPAPTEPDKTFFGIWCDQTIGRINIFDPVGPAPEAIDDIEMWEEQPKTCTNVVFTNQPWHIMFSVANEGQKPVDNWSFGISLVDSLTGVVIPIKNQIHGPPVPVGGISTINWPSPYTFTSDQKGSWRVQVGVAVKDSSNPDADPSDNVGTGSFTVQNKPPTEVTDLAVLSVCAATADSAKQCTSTVFTNQPWHIMFTVRNQGNKPIFNWSFDIFLFDSTTGQVIPIKQQVPGPQIVPGTYTFNWDSPFIFNTGQKGLWTVIVVAKVKDAGNPDADPSNNSGSAFFVVRNKSAPSDIRIIGACVTLADSAKQCTSRLFTHQPWHIDFAVQNLGQKPVDNWSFDIVLFRPGGISFPIKTQVNGPPLPIGAMTAINWASPRIFDSSEKGPWQVDIRTTIKDPGNPDINPNDNFVAVNFTVENKGPRESDIGVHNVCVTQADTIKRCTDTLYTHQPWHIDFTVVNKGQKPVDNWSFDITLVDSLTGATIPIKTQATAHGEDFRWETRASFLDPRTGSGVEGACASLIGGKIYVSHGYRFGDSGLLSVYDIGSNSWSHAGPNPTIARSEMGGGTANGKHYAIGGRTGPTAAVEEYDPGTGIWTTMTSMSLARGGLGVASYANKIYAIGGRSGGTAGTGTIYALNQVFDPTVGVGGTWTPLAPLPTAVSDNYATVAYLGKIYVFGGIDAGGLTVSTTQIYDIGTDTWSTGASMPTARSNAMAGVINGLIPVFGGYNGVDLAVTEVYNPASNTWAAGPAMPAGVSEMAQGVTYDGAGIYSIGSGIFGASRTDVYVLTKSTTLGIGQSVRVNWPSPYLFGSDQKGPWSVFVSVQVKDPTNPDTSLVNNRASDSFVVLNKVAPPVTDIGVHDLCVTLADSAKQCTDTLFTAQPWHIDFNVVNKGQKPVDNWSFDIFLTQQGTPVTIVLKQQILGPLLPLGASAHINWTSPHIFTTDQKGLWQVAVTVTVKDPTNPDASLINNRALREFAVVNKTPPVTDIGVHNVCVTDSTKICTDNVLTRRPWHVLFTVVNKGQKAVDNWSFDMVLKRPDGSVVIPLKTQRPGPPLPLGTAATINWDPNYRFTQSSDKGNWVVVVTVTVKDPTNPDGSLANNADSARFVVDNPTGTLMSLFQAEPVSEGIELRWQFGEPQSIASAELERADAASGPWRAIAAERRDQGGVNVALDRDVQLGQTYYYRIIATTLGNERHVFGPLSGTAGASITEFALPRVAPNPTFGLTQLEFTLPREAPVRLSIVDVQGRVMAVLANGVHRAGRYQATWNGRSERGAAPVGVYLVVYQTPGKSFVRRLVLAR